MSASDFGSDYSRDRDYLARKNFHQLNVFCTHIGQLRGAFSTAYASLHDYPIPASELNLWMELDSQLSGTWSDEEGTSGIALRQLGSSDAEEMVATLDKLLRGVEDRLASMRELDEPDLDELAATAVAAAFLGQILMALKRVLPELEPGRTKETAHDEDDEDDDLDN